MPLYTFIHNLLNVLVQIANKMGFQKRKVLALKARWDAVRTKQPAPSVTAEP
jgi:hypothetical protein